MAGPLIGITSDSRLSAAGVVLYESNPSYSRAVVRAGGLPVILPQEPMLAESFVRLCDGLLLSGGADPRMEAFGQPMHPQAAPVDERRQAFELALLAACAAQADMPVLGVCFGMQLMALHAGGKLTRFGGIHRHDDRAAGRILRFDSELHAGAIAQR